MTGNETELPTNALVSSPEQVWVWPIIGTTLSVPPGKCAIVTGWRGSVVLDEGRHNLEPYAIWWSCTVQYVDKRPHLTQVPPIKARCKDGQEVEFGLAVYWRVKDAEIIAATIDPVDNLIAAAQTSMHVVVEMMPHETFAAGVGDGVINAEVLAMTIATKLKTHPVIQGLEIINVFVTDRQGDKRCLEMINDSVALEQRMELRRKEREFELAQARASRLQEAEIEVEVDEKLLPIKQREADRARAVAASQQRHEQILKMIEAQGLVLSKVAESGSLEVLGDSAPQRPGQAGSNAETILQGLSNLQSIIQDPKPGLQDGEMSDEQIALWTRLLPEIYDIYQVEGVQKCRLTPKKDTKECRVVVFLDKDKLIFTCGPEYPQVKPVVLRADNGREKEVTPWWPEGASLKEMVEIFQGKLQSANLRIN